MTKLNREICRFLAVCIPCGLLYYLAEVFWRGYSFPAMALVGGICFYLCGRVDERQRRKGRNMPVLIQMPVCGVIITAVELLSGIILNRLLGLNMWDYSGIRFNLLGQICLPASIAWTLLSPVAIVMDNLIGWYFFGEPMPKYKWLRANRIRDEPEKDYGCHGLAAYITKQDEVIKIQEEIIDGLFLRLLQHETVSEIDRSVFEDIKRASALRKEE